MRTCAKANDNNYGIGGHITFSLDNICINRVPQWYVVERSPSFVRINSAKKVR